MKQTYGKNQKFIKHFVNEMYAILIGIGLGNVIFAQKIDLTNTFQVTMAFFVTFIVLRYWWDWDECVSENIISSKNEFIIDFMGIIALEFLFGYYSAPLSLAKIFIALGFIDFIWVINYQHQHRKRYMYGNLKWIMQKLFAILIYSSTYTILWLLSSQLSLWYQGGILIISYSIVRRSCYTHVKRIGQFEFRKAIPADSNAIAKINNFYIKRFGNKNGFLISELNEEILNGNITNERDRYFVACDKKNTIFGFLKINTHVSADNEVMDNINWIAPHIQKVYANTTNKLYIEKIAVHNNYLKRNIAGFMYKSLFEQFPTTLFYAFVVLQPYENTSSLKFHIKCNFLKSAIYSSANQFGLKNYKSILLIKPPSHDIIKSQNLDNFSIIHNGVIKTLDE